MLSSWHTLTETRLGEAGRPVQVVGRPLSLVGRPVQKGQPNERWSASPFDGLHIECKLVVWWETSKCGSKIRETSFLTRKPAGGGKVVSQEKRWSPTLVPPPKQ